MNNSVQEGHSGVVAIVLAAIALIGTLVTVGADVYKSTREPDEPKQPIPIPETPKPDSNITAISDNDCQMIGAAQMCWGKAKLKVADSHTRSFAFKFKKKFAGPPIVTNSIDAESSGYAFAVYNHNLTESGYSGRIVEIQFRKGKSPVAFSYIAVGRPLND